MSLIPEAARKVPNEDDIIQDGLYGAGGNCITQNGFLVLLLKALGFDAFVVSGSVLSSISPDNHVICVVRLNTQENYLLDLGVGLPFAEPVPLHNLPYINRAAGFRYLYRKSDKGLYECVQLDGALNSGAYVSYYQYEIFHNHPIPTFHRRIRTQNMCDITSHWNHELSIFLKSR